MFFFFNDTATTEIYTLSLHDALPISFQSQTKPTHAGMPISRAASSAIRASVELLKVSKSIRSAPASLKRDRKSTRLNSSHLVISYAVFCLKKKKQHQ